MTWRKIISTQTLGLSKLTLQANSQFHKLKQKVLSELVQAYDIEVIIVTDFKFAFWEQMKKVSPFSWFIFNLSKYLVSQLVCNSLQVSFYWPLYDIKPLGSRSIEEGPTDYGHEKGFK